MSTTLVDNTGSTARDWCMLERNILSHVKLCLLLSLLSFSILLNDRLSFPSDSESTLPLSPANVEFSVALLLMISALAALVTGAWEYTLVDRDLRDMRAFLAASKPHAAILTVASVVVFSTCIILLADESHS